MSLTTGSANENVFNGLESFFFSSVHSPYHSVAHQHLCGLTDHIKAQRKSDVTRYRFHCHLRALVDRGPHTPSCPHTCHRLPEVTPHPAKDYEVVDPLSGLGSFLSDAFLFIFSVSNQGTCISWSGTKKVKRNQYAPSSTTRRIPSPPPP